jgi:hypothetical protein
MQDRESFDMIPSLHDAARLARGTSRVEFPTLRLDRQLLEHLRSLTADIPSLASARAVRMYDADTDDRLSETTVADLDAVGGDGYAEITIS